MNVCCGNQLASEKLEYNDIEFNLKQGTLKFDNDIGVFKYEDTTKKKEKEEEMENLQKKLIQIKKEKKDYETKISDLDTKIENMKKILSIDIRENQYIKLI